MRLLISLFVFLLTVTSSISVNAQSDSLQYWLNQKDNIEKVNQLQEHAQKIWGENTDKARQLFETTFQISQKIDYTAGMASGYKKRSNLYANEGKFPPAISDIKNALIIFEKTGAPFNDILTGYNNLSAYYRQLGKVDSTIYYFHHALEKYNTWPVTAESPDIQRKLLVTLAFLHENASLGYSYLKDGEKALLYGEKGIEIASKIKDTMRIVFAMINTSHAYYVNKHYKQSLSLSNQAISLGNLVNATAPLAQAWYLKSISFTALSMADSGINAAKRSMEYSRITDRPLYIMTYLILADAYHDKKEYAFAEQVLETGLQEADVVNNVVFRMNLYAKLAKVKYATGQYKQAFDYQEQYLSNKDSMTRQQNKEAVAELEIKYQTAQKEKSLADQQLELQKNRQYIFLGIVLIIGVLLVAALVILQYRNKRKLHRQQLTELHQQKEIQLLQALMQGEEKERSRIAKDLHDGVAGMLAAVKMHFNSLSGNDGSLRLNNSYQQGIHLLDDATAELRKTSHNLMPELLVHHGLDEALRKYCNSISNAQLKIHYHSWGIHHRYNNNFELSVYRILQELLNNIIKHSQASEAMVQLSSHNQLLNITIEDNGVGFNEAVMNSGGMGLYSLSSRVAAMNGKLEIDTRIGNGVNVYLEFDLAGLEKQITPVAG